MGEFTAVGILIAVLVVLCVVRMQKGRGRDERGDPSSTATRSPFSRGERRASSDDAAEREREKEAHYMRNFWSYDGSEQQEWNEEA